MRDTPYYSTRTGNVDANSPYALRDLKDILASPYSQFDGQSYFQEGLGYECVNEGHVGGRVGRDVNTFLMRRTGKRNLWPIDANRDYTEDDIFDLVEFLYDCTGKRLNRRYHSWSNYGYHCSHFDKEAGQEEFRQEFNPVLARYGARFELSAAGEVQLLPPSGLEALVEPVVTLLDETNVEGRINAAITKYRHRASSIEERREAVRALFDVLEFVRKDVKTEFLSKDESDLFNI